MNQAAPRKVWGVRELLNYVTRMLVQDERLQDIAVRGEISGYTPISSSGNIIFSLKEPSGALLKCFLRNQFAAALPPLGNGTEAIAYGSIGTFGSEFQLQAVGVSLVGAGRLAAMYEKIKRRLEGEGLFDPGRKRPLPRYPFRIALVSSPEAEGARDFRKAIEDKAPFVSVKLWPSLVQGPGAVDSLVQALARAQRSDAEVVVLVRGGGSDEDRMPFNDEMLARAIAAPSGRVPVVTGIGHRGDHHIADDVADREAPTPTAAANLLIENFVAFPSFVAAARERLRASLRRRIDERRAHLGRVVQSPYLQRFQRVTDSYAQRIDSLSARMAGFERELLRKRTETLRDLERKLLYQDPGTNLARRIARLQTLDAGLRRAATDRGAQARRTLDERRRRLNEARAGVMRSARSRFDLLRAHLEGKNPETILQQGYAIVRHRGGVVREAGEVAVGEAIEARLWRGAIEARVEGITPDG